MGLAALLLRLAVSSRVSHTTEIRTFILPNVIQGVQHTFFFFDARSSGSAEGARSAGCRSSIAVVVYLGYITIVVTCVSRHTGAGDGSLETLPPWSLSSVETDPGAGRIHRLIPCSRMVVVHHEVKVAQRITKLIL